MYSLVLFMCETLSLHRKFLRVWDHSNSMFIRISQPGIPVTERAERIRNTGQVSGGVAEEHLPHLDWRRSHHSSFPQVLHLQLAWSQLCSSQTIPFSKYPLLLASPLPSLPGRIQLVVIVPVPLLALGIANTYMALIVTGTFLRLCIH